MPFLMIGQGMAQMVTDAAGFYLPCGLPQTRIVSADIYDGGFFAGREGRRGIRTDPRRRSRDERRGVEYRVGEEVMRFDYLRVNRHMSGSADDARLRDDWRRTLSIAAAQLTEESLCR
jgi:hypothetical protein